MINKLAQLKKKHFKIIVLFILFFIANIWFSENDCTLLLDKRTTVSITVRYINQILVSSNCCVQQLNKLRENVSYISSIKYKVMLISRSVSNTSNNYQFKYVICDFLYIISQIKNAF